MIKLSNEVVLKYDQFKIPPTHAKCIHRGAFSNVPEGYSHPLVDSLENRNKNTLLLVYLLGNLNNKVFEPNSHIDPITVLVDLKQYTEHDPENLQHRSLAASHLISEGTIPHPGDPKIPMQIPGKPHGDFRQTDLDVIVSFFNDERLRGSLSTGEEENKEPLDIQR